MAAKISTEIINKLGLIDNNNQCGQSFMYNCRVLDAPKIGKNVYLMECDYDGRPTTNNTLTLLFKSDVGTNTAQITPEFIECVEQSIVINTLKSIVAKQRHSQ